jgi:hypothetical protein
MFFQYKLYLNNVNMEDMTREQCVLVYLNGKSACVTTPKQKLNIF